MDFYDRFLTDLAALIQGLNLTGSGVVSNVGSAVFAQTQGEAAMLLATFPCVLVTSEGQTEEEAGRTFRDDWVRYPAIILIYDQVDVVNPSLAAPVYRGWREQIQAMIRQRVNPPLTPNCPELIEMDVKNLPSIPQGVPTPDLVVSSLLGMGLMSRTRGSN